MAKLEKPSNTTLVLIAAAIAAVAILLASPYARRVEENRRSAVAEAFAAPLPAPDTPASEVTFVVFDTETTGVNPNYARIVEIAAVKIRGGEIEDEVEWLINPKHPISPESREIHGISPEMIADKPDFNSVYKDFARFCAGAILVAHNANFDVTFVRNEAIRYENPLPPNPVLDSLRLFRRRYPDLEDHTLQAVAEHAGIDLGQFHRAVDDSRMVGLILAEIISREEAGFTLQALQEQAGGVLLFE